ncbi:MAG: alpha/beta hydrolase [Candidatus Paceibacterota bacterium]|jgi:pimeloyl-ACP methyl ester carboxylesterase
MKESYFKNKGLYYRTNNFEKGRPTLVFIHGLSGSSSAWIPYEKIFNNNYQNKYNILTYDIRGHGMSKKYPNYKDYKIKNMAEDLNDLLTSLDVSKVSLISHSFGALIALEYIKLNEENVSSNILLSPISDLNKNLSTKFLRIILKLSKIFNLFSFNPKKGGHVDYTKHLNTTDWDIKRIYPDIQNTTLRTYLYCLRQSLGLPSKELLRKIKTPTLIVHGLKDTMVSVKNSIIMSKNIKNSEFFIFPNADHFAIFSNIQEISEAIDSFLNKNKKTFS